MTTQIDSRLTKVLAFETGKTYGGYTVESRTACFVTFQGQKRRKVEICDGVESVPVYTYPHGIERIVDIAAFEEHPNDIEPTELDIVAIYDNRTAKALPAPIAHTMATPIKVVEPTFQEVADKAIAHGYTLINIGSAVNRLPMYRLINTATGVFAHDFSMLCLADVGGWLDVQCQALVNTVFITGQTHEAPNADSMWDEWDIPIDFEAEALTEFADADGVRGRTVTSSIPYWGFEVADELLPVATRRQRELTAIYFD